MPGPPRRRRHGPARPPSGSRRPLPDLPWVTPGQAMKAAGIAALIACLLAVTPGPAKWLLGPLALLAALGLLVLAGALAFPGAARIVAAFLASLPERHRAAKRKASE
jgi:hypothetical protein